MEQLIDKILEMHRLSKEISERVVTCGFYDNPRWHILGYDSFVKVARELNACKLIKERDTGSGPLRWEYFFEYRGVEVFCLSNERREVTKDAEET